MREQQEDFWRVNGEPEDSPNRRLQAARDKIMLAYYDRLEAASAAKKRAEEDAALEAEAREDYQISFKTDLKGGSR